jgi:hypothetical protein
VIRASARRVVNDFESRAHKEESHDMRAEDGRHAALVRLRFLVLLAATLSLSACGKAGDNEIVSRTDFSTWAVEPEMRIDGHAEVMVPIGWMGIAQDGAIVVMQTQDASLRIFDSEGRPVGEIGGRGQGPGEFERPLRGGWKGDSLWVSDVSLERVSLFAPDFAFSRVLAPVTIAEPARDDLDRLPRFPFVSPYGLYPGDTLLLSGQWGAGDPLGAGMEGLPILLRTAADGTIQQVVMEVPRNEGAINVTHERGITGAGVPFFPRPLWAVAPGGDRIAVVTTQTSGAEEGSFYLRVTDERGAGLVERRIAFQPVRISRHVADSAIQATVGRIQPPEVARIVEREIRERMPQAYPPVHTLLIGSDRRIWLGLRVTEQGAPWLVLDSGGDPVGRVFLPSNQAVRAADAEHLWVTERDELGVESVIRLRIRER